MYYSKFILTEQTAGSYWSPPILGKYTACMWQRALQGNGENEQTNYGCSKPQNRRYKAFHTKHGEHTT